MRVRLNQYKPFSTPVKEDNWMEQLRLHDFMQYVAVTSHIEYFANNLYEDSPDEIEIYKAVYAKAIDAGLYKPKIEVIPCGDDEDYIDVQFLYWSPLDGTYKPAGDFANMEMALFEGLREYFFSVN